MRSRGFEDRLAQMAAEGAGASEIAAEVVAAWREIDAVLGPVVGRRAVAAIYHRSLYLTARQHVWLTLGSESPQPAIDATALRVALIAQRSATAALAGAAHLQRFHEVLAGLIGESLGERLLAAAWARRAGMGSQPPG